MEREAIPLPQDLRGLVFILRAIRSLKGFKWGVTGTNLCFRKILLDATRWRMDYREEVAVSQRIGDGGAYGRS